MAASISLAGALALAVGLTSFPDSAAAAWKPNKPVKFVIMAGRGKDADRLARLMWDIVRKSNLSSKPFVPINKAGESGAEALRYLRDRRRDRHVVMVTTNEFFTAPLRNPDLGIARA